MISILFECTAWWQYVATAVVIAITLCQAFGLVLFAIRRYIIKGRYPLYTHYYDSQQLTGSSRSTIIVKCQNFLWVVCLVLIQWWYQEEIMDVITSLVDKSLTRFGHDKKIKAFQNLKMRKKSHGGEMHPTARSNRDTAISFIKDLSNATGKTPIPLIGSKHFPGSGRTLYDITDPGGAKPPGNVSDLLIPCIDNFDLVPLNYYGDFLAAGATIINYTYCINGADFGGDVRTLFEEDGTLVIQVQSSEGLPATYRHKIVNHPHDKVLFPKSDGGLVLCEVRARYIGCNRVMYQYTRLAECSNDISIFRSLVNPFKEFPMVHYYSFIGLSSVFFSLYEDTVITRIGHPEWYSLKNDVFDDVVVASSDNSYSMSSLKKHAGLAGHPYSLMQLLRKGGGHKTFIKMSTNPKRTFAANYDVDDLKAKYAVSVVPPFVETGAVAAYDDPAASICAIKERILDIRPDPLEQDFTPDSYVEEFVGYLTRFCGKLEPLSEQEALDQLIPDKKRATLSALNKLTTRFFHASFVKREVYNEAKAFRNISCIDTCFNLEYSRYVKPLTDALKSLSWFAVGSTPKELELSMSTLFDSHPERDLIECDVSKFDGSQGPRSLGLMRKLLHGVYGDQSSDDLCMEMCNTILSDKYGNYYNSHYTRKSGSRDTTLGNTLVNAFTNYYYYRHYEKLGIEESFDSIGLCHGDDYIGLISNGDNYEKAWSDNGFKIKIVNRELRDYATFLGRVWMPNGVSFLDPSRHIPKIHMTTGVDGDDPYAKLADKWGGLYSQDSGSIVGEIAFKLLKWVCRLKPDLAGKRAHIDRMDKEGVPISELLDGTITPVWREPPIEYSKRYLASSFSLTDAELDALLSNDPDHQEEWHTLARITSDYNAIIDGHPTGEPKEVPTLTLESAKKDQICYRQFILKQHKGGRMVQDCLSCDAPHIQNICHKFLQGKCKRQVCPRYHASATEIRIAKQLSC